MKQNEERIKMFLMYCDRCGYQKSGSYFDPANCPNCRRRLNFIYLNKEQYDSYIGKIEELGCRDFAKKYMVRGSFTNGRFDRKSWCFK